MRTADTPAGAIYVENVADGLITTTTAAIAEAAIGRTVDLGTGRFTTMRDVIVKIARQMDAEDQLAFEPIEERPLEQVRLAAVSTSEDLIGWRLGIDLAEGLQRTIAHYRELFRTEASTP